MREAVNILDWSTSPWQTKRAIIQPQLRSVLHTQSFHSRLGGFQRGSCERSHVSAHTLVYPRADTADCEGCTQPHLDGSTAGASTPSPAAWVCKITGCLSCCGSETNPGGELPRNPSEREQFLAKDSQMKTPLNPTQNLNFKICSLQTQIYIMLKLYPNLISYHSFPLLPTLLRGVERGAGNKFLKK